MRGLRYYPPWCNALAAASPRFTGFAPGTRLWAGGCELAPGKGGWPRAAAHAYCPYARDRAVQMNIPMNDLSRAYRDNQAEFARILTEAGASGYYLNGPRTKAFAQAFAAYVGVPHCLPVANGSDALELALRAAGVRAGDHVLTVANAGGYTSVACRIVGAVPVYADIDPATLLMDLDAAVALLSPQVKAVVITHLYGAVADVEAFKAKARAAGRICPPIVEDCAQAHGATLRGRKAGSFGDMAAFSFYPTKNLGAFGDAGAVLCRDQIVMERLMSLHQYGWNAKYTVSRPYGRNSRMDEIQAAVLSARLPGLDAANQARRDVIDAYAQAAPSCVAFPSRPDQVPAGHLAVVLVEDRERFRAHLTQRGIGTDIHYPVLDCDQPGWRDMPQVLGPLANSRQATRRIVSLPCFPELTREEILTVADALAAYAP